MLSSTHSGGAYATDLSFYRMVFNRQARGGRVMSDIKIGGVSIFYSEGEQEFQLSYGWYDLIRMGATGKEIKTLINYFRRFVPDHKNIEAERDALKKMLDIAWDAVQEAGYEDFSHELRAFMEGKG